MTDYKNELTEAFKTGDKKVFRKAVSVACKGIVSRSPLAGDFEFLTEVRNSRTSAAATCEKMNQGYATLAMVETLAGEMEAVDKQWTSLDNKYITNQAEKNQRL